MTIAELKERIEAIKRGEYEQFTFSPEASYSLAVACLKREVASIAWQPGYREEAWELISLL